MLRLYYGIVMKSQRRKMLRLYCGIVMKSQRRKMLRLYYGIVIIQIQNRRIYRPDWHRVVYRGLPGVFRRVFGRRNLL